MSIVVNPNGNPSATVKVWFVLVAVANPITGNRTKKVMNVRVVVIVKA
jgi:hypothetical protein